MHARWLLINMLAIASLTGMNQPLSQNITLESKLEVALSYWTSIKTAEKSLIHGKGSGHLKPNESICLDPNPESQASDKQWYFPLKLYVTAAHTTKTMTKRYIIEEYGHYVFVPDQTDVFFLKKGFAIQP